MTKEEAVSKLAALLAIQQGLTRPIMADHRICRDLGVCGGDFQEFMASVWRTYDLPPEGQVQLDIPEATITVDDVAALVAQARSA